MNKLKMFLSLLFFVFPLFLTAQSDIPVDQLPVDVKSVLEKYVELLRGSSEINQAATKFKDIAGGSLVNDDGSLRSTVPQMSLKKDFNNIKHYANPIKITRISLSTTNGDGYGKNKIKGKVYKIWIAKDDPAKGMPAPVTIILPEGHETITTPKVTNVGSY